MNKIYIGLVILTAFFIQSCSEMNDLHEGYLEEGETIYAAKLDSVSDKPGNYRIELELIILSQRIETVRIYWNDYADSSDVSIGNQIGTFSHILNNMEERNYIFQCVSLDLYGNPSLPFEVTGQVYGDNYQSQLLNRRVSTDVVTVDTVENVLALNWTILSALDQGVMLEYFDADSALVLLTVPADEAITYIESWKPESTFKYSTLYKPVGLAIDVFGADYKENVFPQTP